MLKRYVESLLITITVSGTSILSPVYGAAPVKVNARQQALRQARDDLRHHFMNFFVGLLRWTARAYSKAGTGESRAEIIFKFSSEEFAQLHEFFEQHRDLLWRINRQNDLFMIKGQEIIPQELFSFIKLNFSLRAANAPIDASKMLQAMIGGSQTKGARAVPGQGGLLDKVNELNLSEWGPIKTFIDQFKDTLTLDTRLANNFGRVLLPLLHHYFNYMDTISRLRLFKELAEDWQNLDISGERNHDNEEVAVKIFQSTGPVLIKYLQQLQEEIVGETPISRVLDGLKHSKPMPHETVELLCKREIAKIYDLRRINNFSFTPEPLGIASIAQTHLIRYGDTRFVVKILKERVDEVFARERAMLRAILSDEKNSEDFDKGLKQSIENMISGIAEEMDFAHEAHNIRVGQQVYGSGQQGIRAVELADLRKIKDDQRPLNLDGARALVMSLAPGEPLGNVLKHGNEGELKTAYILVQHLYREFLRKALDATYTTNFYHGDLHRENIFIDARPPIGNPYLTLIDFGNAGIMSPHLRASVITILRSTRDTNNSRNTEKYIEKLAAHLHKFIAGESIKNSRDPVTTKALINTYFATCFNPTGSIEQKMLANQQISDKKDELLAQRKQLLADISQQGADVDTLQQKILDLQDSVDFINALLGNCLNGSTNKLLTTLAEQNSVSEKLIVVFQELEKNGISLPKDIIFFNKSKALLEGILTNIAQKLSALKSPFQYVEPEDIFDQVIKRIKS